MGEEGHVGRGRYKLLSIRYSILQTSLVVQGQRLCAPNAGGPGPGLIPGQETRSHRKQLRVHVPQLRIPHTATKTDDPASHNEDPAINKEIF